MFWLKAAFEVDGLTYGVLLWVSTSRFLGYKRTRDRAGSDVISVGLKIVSHYSATLPESRDVNCHSGEFQLAI